MARNKECVKIVLMRFFPSRKVKGNNSRIKFVSTEVIAPEGRKRVVVRYSQKD
jgi:hypothetical protein